MQHHLFLVAIATALSATAMAQQQAPAFPGAEGNGRYTTGGRGGKIIHVTNLNDSGTGSLRQAVKGDEKKTIVFDVGGVIALTKTLNIGNNTTILGQTAPYPGVTLRYFTVEPGSNNVIRFIRVRRGEEKEHDDGADAITTRHQTGIIIDHCSFSWSIDEVASFYDNNNFTMQWCTIAESLNNAGHNKGAHGYGGIWGGKLASFHHNMIAHVNNRAPRFNGARYNWTGYTANTEYEKYNWQNAVQAENVDFRNCLMFDWGGGQCYGGPGGGYINMVNNYYKASPETNNKNRVTQVSIANSTTSDNPIFMDMTSRYYIQGNYVAGYGANYDWKGVKYDDGIQTIDGERYTLDSIHAYGSAATYVNNSKGIPCVKIKLDQPMAPTGEVTTHTAQQAYAKILAYGGANLYRDDVDARYMEETENGQSTYTGSVTGVKGRIDRVADVDGYTEKNFPTGQRPAGYDTDNDGMPDAWETANGLNPNNASDALTYSLDSKGLYTNLEVFANSLVEDIMKGGNADAESAVDEYYPTAKKTDGIDYYSGRIVERVSDNGGDDTDPTTPTTQTTGSITWTSPTNGGEATTVEQAVANGISATSTTLGSSLSAASSRTVGGITFSLFQPAAKDAAATETNAVALSFTLKDGCTFQPTQISFAATRIGTDGGLIDVVYATPTASQTVASAIKPNRNNNADAPYTQTDQSITGIAAADGTHTLSLHIYSLDNTKQVGLANIAITGTLFTPTGIAQTMTVSPRRGNTAYTLTGQRATANYKGIVIEGGKKIICR